MNCKIIETNAPLPDLLLYRDTIEEEEDFHVAVVQAYGHQAGSEEEEIYFQLVRFDTEEAVKRFIIDFSPESAISWLKERELTFKRDEKQ